MKIFDDRKQFEAVAKEDRKILLVPFSITENSQKQYERADYLESALNTVIVDSSEYGVPALFNLVVKKLDETPIFNVTIPIFPTTANLIQKETREDVILNKRVSTTSLKLDEQALQIFSIYGNPSTLKESSLTLPDFKSIHISDERMANQYDWALNYIAHELAYSYIKLLQYGRAEDAEIIKNLPFMKQFDLDKFHEAKMMQTNPKFMYLYTFKGFEYAMGLQSKSEIEKGKTFSNPSFDDRTYIELCEIYPKLKYAFKEYDKTKSSGYGPDVFRIKSTNNANGNQFGE